MTSSTEKFPQTFRIKFPTKRIFQIFMFQLTEWCHFVIYLWNNLHINAIVITFAEKASTLGSVNFVWQSFSKYYRWILLKFSVEKEVIRFWQRYNFCCKFCIFCNKDTTVYFVFTKWQHQSWRRFKKSDCFKLSSFVIISSSTVSNTKMYNRVTPQGTWTHRITVVIRHGKVKRLVQNKQLYSKGA